MKNASVSVISKLRSDCVKKLSKNDIDYELPIMVLVVALSVILMLTVTL